MISDEKFAVSQELMEQAYDYLKDGYEQALNALEEAEAENTKLRKELDAEHALAETLGHYHEHAQAENDRLRELVRTMAYCMQYERDCDGCRLNGADGAVMEPAGCDGMRDRMRELGVEVDA